MNDAQLLEMAARITKAYVAELRGIPVGVSNRHVHLCRADLLVLFGAGAALRRKKELGQPGQYAAEETLTLRGPKGAALPNVRVLGPVRAESQVEISLTDGFQLGISAPVRESGLLEDTPGILLEGPAGSLQLARGVIIARRHIHLSTERARLLGVRDKEAVTVETGGVRGCILKNVLVRVSDQFAPEMHIDTDEANTCGLKNGDLIRLEKVVGNGVRSLWGDEAK